MTQMYVVLDFLRCPKLRLFLLGHQHVLLGPEISAKETNSPEKAR